MTVVDGIAYVADGPGGLQIIDVSNPSNPILISVYDTFDYASSVSVVNGIAYVAAYYNDGLQMIDVTNPANPTFIKSHPTDGSAFKVTVVGGMAYIADGVRSMQIVDVSNPLNPDLIV